MLLVLGTARVPVLRAQWTRVAPNLTAPPTNGWGGAMSFRNGILWLAREDLYRSTDSGLTWSKRADLRKITAAGVVTAVDVEPGQVVAAGQPVLTLAHDGPRDAVFSVPEDLGPALRPLVGKAGGVQVRRWGSADWVHATVREVAAATDPLTRTYLAKADVAGAAVELGQTASVQMRVPTRVTSGVPVPLPAVVEREGQTIVWVLDPRSMTVQPQAVVTGDVLGNVVLVAKGLQPGQEVVTAGTHVLQPGQKVRRFQEAAAAASAPRS